MNMRNHKPNLQNMKRVLFQCHKLAIKTVRGCIFKELHFKRPQVYVRKLTGFLQLYYKLNSADNNLVIRKPFFM